MPESVYQKILVYELEENGLNLRSELLLPIKYDNKIFDINFTINIDGIKRVVNNL